MQRSEIGEITEAATRSIEQKTLEHGMSESEFKIEWLFSNLRWFFLIATASVTGLTAALTDTPFSQNLIVLLSIGAVANFIIMLMLMLNAFRRPIPMFTLTLDIILALGLIADSGGGNSPLLFVSLIPIITTALRFSWIASLSLAIIIVSLYWLQVWNSLNLSTDMDSRLLLANLLPYLISGLVLLLAGSAISYIGSRIKETLIMERDSRENQVQVALDAAHQRVRLIFELASTLSATLNYERVLEAALDVSKVGLREFIEREIEQVGIILLFGMDQTLYVASAQGLPHQDTRKRFPAQQGVLEKALQGEPVVTNAPGSDPELSQLISMHHCRQAAIVPLLAGFESYGLLVLGSPEENTYSPDFLDLLVAVCNQAVMALQNARLYQELLDEKERLVDVEENARKKLARDLHDGPTQTIAAIAMRLNYIRLLVDKEPPKAITELEQLETLARRTTKEIRQMLFTLRPLILETQGLVPALEQYFQKLAETLPMPVHLEAEPDVQKLLDKEAQGAIFYIVEEAITNARKHAEAKQIWVRIYKHGTNVVAEIEDDGKGFNVAAVEKRYAERGSLGMLNLHERASLAQGKTVIQSKPGRGTKITVTVPARREAAHHLGAN